MTIMLVEQRDIIQAAMDDSPIEYRPRGIEAERRPFVHPTFDFSRFEYRVKPPALRPHWPAVVRNAGTTAWWVTDELFADVATARIELLSDSDEVRLATEYPPVMLP